MPERSLHVILTREKGLFVIEPAEGKSQAELVLEALGLGGGYSGGKVYVDVPEGAAEAWVAWVEGAGPNGHPYFNFRAFDSDLSEEEVVARLEARGETPLKLNRSEVYRSK